jgi:integrase/recombinase XerC
MDYKESFLQYLKIEKRYSLHTVRSYRNDLDQFFTSLSGNNMPEGVQEVTSHQIRAWIVSLMDGGISASSVLLQVPEERGYNQQ